MPILIVAVVWLRRPPEGRRLGVRRRDRRRGGRRSRSASSLKGQRRHELRQARSPRSPRSARARAKTRFEIWQAAIAAIKARPIFGFGPDTFRLVFPKYKPVAYTQDAGYLSVADNVHNYPLQLTAGVGIPGTLMIYGLIGWELVATARHAFDREAGYKRLLYASIWASVIGYVVLLMTGLSVTGSTLFLWVFLGLLAVPLAKIDRVQGAGVGQDRRRSRRSCSRSSPAATGCGGPAPTTTTCWAGSVR